MQEEAKTKLATVDDAAAALDLRRDYRDYRYGRGGTTDPEETHLRDYWRIIRRRLWVPITVVAVVVTLTTLYMLRLPSIYEGKTTVQIDQENRSVNLKDISINMGSDDPNYIATELKNLQSARIAFRVAKLLDLEHNPAFLGGRLIAGARPVLQVAEGETDEQAEMVRLTEITDRLLGGVDIRPVRDTRLIEIRYRHEDREVARKVSDAWALAFMDNTKQSRIDASNNSAAFLERKISDYKIKVKEASEQLHNYRRNNEYIDFGDKENLVVARLSALNGMLLEAEDERKKAQAVYESSRAVRDAGELADVQRDEAVINLNKRLTEMRQQRAQLLVKYTPEWPEVKQVEEQINQLDGELQTSYQRILSRIETQYRSAVARENSLRSDFVRQRNEALQQSEGAITAKLLQQEIDTNQAMLEKLLESQKQIDVAAAEIVKGNIRITEQSELPRAPVAPKRLNNILLSFVLSLIGGVGLVLFLDYINNKIESVEDIDRYLRLPALGVIPMFEANKAAKLLGRGGAATGKELVSTGAPARGGSVILTDVEANSPIAESYRQLRTSLLLSSAGHAPRTLLITSSQPAEGKTTTSVNTAISLAQTGAAVLIVDADLRRPRVHKIFGLKNNAGLCNCLAGDADLSSLIQAAMPNLYVLPVGPLPPNPAELLGSARMKQIVETLQQNFDYVVIDSPPVASFADSLILSAMVEGVIIVVKGGVTPREMAQRTRSLLQSVGAKILGVVVNQIRLQPHDYYYYSTYYTQYYYGEDEKKNSA
ncbi:MAG: polysaccharide biosynthesis tyrosine autokinase [Acidobacteria bacterium]|nr:polysaccharide biosynthesis tyrosine autokinase [Acidobacteriota bacterium]MCW5969304.1 polysaccharide biosynthesis tyrosine autokinase [Blastocatellales bacterium]